MRGHERCDLPIRVILVLALVGAVLFPRPGRHRAAIPPIEVLTRSSDACAEETGAAKVALLFLTAGDVFHTDTWMHWLRSAAGILPVETATESVCELQGLALDAAATACRAPSDDVIGQQHLFSIYVHLSAEIHETKLNKLWRPYLIKNRVPTEWGTHTLVEATRHLLWEAFRDPANQRFVLLSESDLPIWNSLTMYRQLMAGERSRVDAWWHPDLSGGRWSPRMEAPPANVRLSEWRKSAQWFALVRSHVEVVLNDRAVFKAFEDYCRSGWDQDLRRWRECYSDEHYMATLLHMNGLQEETVPSPLGVTAADWSEGNPHPREYQPAEIVPELFANSLRHTQECPLTHEQHAAVQEASMKTFVPLSQVLGDQRQAWCASRGTHNGAIPSQQDSLLPSTCFLFARKFGPASVKTVLDLFLNCSSGLDLVGDAVCAEARPFGAGGLSLGRTKSAATLNAVSSAAEHVASQAIELLESVSTKLNNKTE